MRIGSLRPGVEPQSVLPAASDAAARLTTVEARDVGLTAGQPHVTIRFTGADDGEARGVGSTVRAALAELAQVGATELTRRDGSRWTVVH